MALNRTVILERIKTYFQNIAPVRIGFTRKTKSDEIWLEILRETRQRASYGVPTLATLEIQLTYIFTTRNLELEIENKRLTIIDAFNTMLNTIEYTIDERLEIYTDYLDENSGVVGLIFKVIYNDN